MMLEGQLVLVRSSKLITLEDKAETFHLFFAISAVDLKHARQTVEGFDFFLNLSFFSGHIAPPLGPNTNLSYANTALIRCQCKKAFAIMTPYEYGYKQKIGGSPTETPRKT